MKKLVVVLLLVVIANAFTGCIVDDYFDSHDKNLYSYDNTRRTEAPRVDNTVKTVNKPQPTNTPQPTTAPKNNAVVTTTKTTVDKRVPNYNGTTTNYNKYKYSWRGQNGQSYWIQVSVDLNVYNHYKGLDRYYEPSVFIAKYVNDKYNASVLSSIASAFRSLQKNCGLSDRQMIEEVINFVQQCIVYQTDEAGKGQAEYPKYPIETFVEGRGDCEDSAMLLYGIVNKLGYASCLIKLPGHLAVGLSCSSGQTGTYYTVGGKNYFYIEQTGANWEIGNIPSSYVGKTATIYTR